MRIYLMTLTLLFSLALNAQNPVLVDEPKDIPSNLGQIVGSEFNKGDTLQKFTQNILNNLATSHLQYVNGKVSIYNLYDWSSKDFANRLRQVLTKEPQKIKKIYKTLLPVMKAYFKQMTLEEQQMYIAAIAEAKAYVTTFDLAKEKADLKTLGSSSFIETKGDLKAFIYRRIAKGELTQKQCLKWIKRIAADFKRANSKNTYFISDKNYGLPQIALGSKFSIKNKAYQLMRKEGSIYKPIEIKQAVEVFDPYRNGFKQLGAESFLQIYKLENGLFGLYLFLKDRAPFLVTTMVASDKEKHLKKHTYNYLEHENVLCTKNAIFAINKDQQIEKIDVDADLLSKQGWRFKYADGQLRYIIKNPKLKIDRASIKGMYYPFKHGTVIHYDDKLCMVYYGQSTTTINVDLEEMISTPDYCIWTLKNGEKIFWVRNEKLKYNMPYQTYKLPSKYQYKEIVRTNKIDDDQRTHVLFRNEQGLMGLFGYTLSSEESDVFIEPKYKNLDFIKIYEQTYDNEMLSVEMPTTLSNYKGKDLFLYQQETNDAYGIINREGKELSKEFAAKVYYLGIDKEEGAVFAYLNRERTKLGLLNQDAKVLVEAKYTSIRIFSQKDDLKLIVSTTANNEKPNPSIKEQHQGAEPYRLYALVDVRGNEILKEEYIGIKDASLANDTKRYLLGKQLDKEQYAYALADENWKLLTDFKFTFNKSLDTLYIFDPETFEEEIIVRQTDDYRIVENEETMEYVKYYKFKVNGKTGLYDINGRLLVEPDKWQIENIFYDSAKFLKLKGEKMCGYFDMKTNKMLLSGPYKNILPVRRYVDFNVVVQSFDGHQYAVLNDPNAKANFCYKDVEVPYSESSVLLVSKNGNDFAMLKNGKEISPYRFKKTKETFVDFDLESYEEVLVEYENSCVNSYSKKLGLLILFDGEQYGMYNLEGELVQTGTLEELKEKLIGREKITTK